MNLLLTVALLFGTFLVLGQARHQTRTLTLSPQRMNRLVSRMSLRRGLLPNRANLIGRTSRRMRVRPARRRVTAIRRIHPSRRGRLAYRIRIPVVTQGRSSRANAAVVNSPRANNKRVVMAPRRSSSNNRVMKTNIINNKRDNRQTIIIANTANIGSRRLSQNTNPKTASGRGRNQLMSSKSGRDDRIINNSPVVQSLFPMPIQAPQQPGNPNGLPVGIGAPIPGGVMPPINSNDLIVSENSLSQMARIPPMINGNSLGASVSGGAMPAGNLPQQNDPLLSEDRVKNMMARASLMSGANPMATPPNIMPFEPPMMSPVADPFVNVNSFNSNSTPNSMSPSANVQGNSLNVANTNVLALPQEPQLILDPATSSNMNMPPGSNNAAPSTPFVDPLSVVLQNPGANSLTNPMQTNMDQLLPSLQNPGPNTLTNSMQPNMDQLLSLLQIPGSDPQSNSNLDQLLSLLQNPAANPQTNSMQSNLDLFSSLFQNSGSNPQTNSLQTNTDPLSSLFQNSGTNSPMNSMQTNLDPLSSLFQNSGANSQRNPMQTNPMLLENQIEAIAKLMPEMPEVMAQPHGIMRNEVSQSRPTSSNINPSH